MNNLRKKSENIIYNNFKKLKCLGINLMKKVKDLYNENYKSREKKSMKTLENRKTSNTYGSMDQETQHCGNDYATKSNLYGQCNHYLNSNDILP
jgi:hypothetical protein